LNGVKLPVDYLPSTEADADYWNQLIEDQRRGIFTSCHSACVGHYGWRETCRRISEITQQKWSHKSREVKRWIDECYVCQICAGKLAFGVGTELGDLAATQLAEVLHIDTIGPYSPNPDTGDRYLIICVEGLSRHMVIISVRDTSARSAIGAVKRYLERHPCPEQIRTDAGSQFNNIEFSNFLRAANVIHRVGIPGAHRTNGVVESSIRCVRRLERGFMVERGWNIWRSYPLIAEIRNSTPIRTTGFAPNRLMIGKRLDPTYPK
jgi:transposase InsO family protein